MQCMHEHEDAHMYVYVGVYRVPATAWQLVLFHESHKVCDEIWDG
jgi:hypothetical protein